jgi:predicted DNA-binding transcriptional regulator YafY
MEKQKDMAQRPPPRRNLSAGRLRRLLEISALVRRNPRLRMAEVLGRLSISRSQFYRDRGELLRLGFSFGRRARLSGFTLAQDALLPPVEISISELLSLSAAVSALARTGDTATAYLGLRSLLAVLARLPEMVRAALTPFVEEVVLAGGFGCPLQVLEVLEQAIDEGRRIVIRRADNDDPLTLDPERIAPEGGKRLQLEGLWVEQMRPVAVPLAEITEAGFTPFLTPEPQA